ncbi:EXTL3 [Mytilus coruscus]|uniref:EXTL3 n=1 Tax=Mytilus coruscus TaxID=42192 RepID=A0A6J8D557_MYTCO|nr:EXTL3 [Mytilus coruscus]
MDNNSFWCMASKYLIIYIISWNCFDKITTRNASAQDEEGKVRVITYTLLKKAVMDLKSDSTECTMTSCFNFTKCSVTEGLRVYFYCFDSAFSSKFTVLNLFHTGNIYITSDPSEACLFVIDTSKFVDCNHNKNINAQILNMSSWDIDGTNHILINLEAKHGNVDTFRHFTAARTIKAQSNFVETNFRPGYDIVIPEISKMDTRETSRPFKRSFLFSFLGFFSGNLHNHGRFNVNDVVKYFNNIQSKLDNNIYIKTTCKYFNSGAINDEFLVCMNESERMNVLKRSTFSLILPSINISHKSTEVMQFRITEALKFGAIPVVFGDDIVLPFKEIFDWRMLPLLYLCLRYRTFIIGKPLISHLYSSLENMDPKKKDKESGPNNITHYEGGRSYEQFTIVMLLYDRMDVMLENIASLKGLPFLSKVIIIWNNPINSSIQLTWPEIGVPIHLIRTPRNSLNNRYLPYDLIQTDAILSLDDDCIMKHDDILLAFR